MCIQAVKRAMSYGVERKLWNAICLSLGFIGAEDMSARPMATIFHYFATVADASPKTKIGIVVFASFGTWFYLSGHYEVLVVVSSGIGALLAFLWYNVFTKKNKIFMGDSGSMLLGLYDDDGLLHHIGFCSSFKAAERVKLTPLLEGLIKPPGFTGQAPGGPSRWSTRRTDEWKPLDPKLVVEVEYDHFTNGRFRHGTRFIRWRPDKKPRQCTFDQLGREKRSPLVMLDSTKRK